jgi:glyoxylase-like metal-dependent hydrolase (beta-lactamase superfamily II)
VKHAGMKVIETDRFEQVKMIRLGYSPIGSPLMSVWMYVLDGLVIDTGQHHMAKAVKTLLSQEKMSRIALTHHHEDHSGNAAMLSAAYAIPVLGHPLAAAKLKRGFAIRPYQYLVWGKAPAVDVRPLKGVIETERFALLPVQTPGHSKDHLVFFEKQHGWLFTGDLYLGERIKYFRSDERLADQIASLKKVLQFEFDALFCAHNPCLTHGKSRIRNKLQFLEDFYGQVKLLAAKGFSERAVIKAMDPAKDRLIKRITMGNVSFANMVRSAMASMAQDS